MLAGFGNGFNAMNLHAGVQCAFAEKAHKVPVLLVQ